MMANNGRTMKEAIEILEKCIESNLGFKVEPNSWTMNVTQGDVHIVMKTSASSKASENNVSNSYISSEDQEGIKAFINSDKASASDESSRSSNRLQNNIKSWNCDPEIYDEIDDEPAYEEDNDEQDEYRDSPSMGSGDINRASKGTKEVNPMKYMPPSVDKYRNHFMPTNVAADLLPHFAAASTNPTVEKRGTYQKNPPTRGPNHLPEEFLHVPPPSDKVTVNGSIPPAIYKWQENIVQPAENHTAAPSVAAKRTTEDVDEPFLLTTFPIHSFSGVNHSASLSGIRLLPFDSQSKIINPNSKPIFKIFWSTKYMGNECDGVTGGIHQNGTMKNLVKPVERYIKYDGNREIIALTKVHGEHFKIPITTPVSRIRKSYLCSKEEPFTVMLILYRRDVNKVHINGWTDISGDDYISGIKAQNDKIKNGDEL